VGAPGSYIGLKVFEIILVGEVILVVATVGPVADVATALAMC
jgi:hypothetical protein